jgi:hypothetical protein
MESKRENGVMDDTFRVYRTEDLGPITQMKKDLELGENQEDDRTHWRRARTMDPIKTTAGDISREKDANFWSGLERKGCEPAQV